jgi:hypothetical protein
MTKKTTSRWSTLAGCVTLLGLVISAPTITYEIGKIRAVNHALGTDKIFDINYKALLGNKEKSIESNWNELRNGLLAYEPERSMVEGRPELIRIRISRTGTIDTDTGFRGDVQVEILRTSPLMSAEILGRKEDFRIELLSSYRQAMVDSTDWVWRVTPLNHGDLSLVLKIVVQIPIPESNEVFRDAVVKETTITVEANPQWRIAQFWGNNWQWILGSPLVLGLLAWLATRGLKRKKTLRAGF